MRQLREYVKQASNFHFPRVVNEYLSTKVAKPSIIRATNGTIHKIVKDELERLGNDANLNHIDVSECTDLWGLFMHNSKNFNFYGDISEWDVSNVIDMRNMFFGCSMFNCDISGWDTGKVENMEGMFQGCREFNQPIGGWDVSNVEDMKTMFCKCFKFNQQLNGWQTGKVTNMNSMFDECKTFNMPIGDWDVRKVEDTIGMFWGAERFDQDLSKWELDSINTYRACHDMFSECPIRQEYKPKLNSRFNI